MEIKTCEEYVLNELRLAQEKIDSLEATNARNTDTLKYAGDVINMFGSLFKLEEGADGRWYIKTKVAAEEMYFDVNTEGGKKAFAYLAPILIPGYKNSSTGKNKKEK